jgi:putative pyruvate formate lyase activating enzyme
MCKNSLAEKTLSRYFAVAQNRKVAKFQIAQKIPAEFNKDDSLEKLWLEHVKRTKEFYWIESEIDKIGSFKNMVGPEKSYFDLKLEIASRILQNCHLCSRKCGVNRSEGSVGFCGCGSQMQVSSMFAHMGEEPELIPSGTIFTLGCTMRCKHCQNWTISQWVDEGQEYFPKELATKIDQLRYEGCKNANLVGGDPTPWLMNWLQTFKHIKSNIPLIWNSNGYYSPETASLLMGFVDVYLLDFKYGPAECSEKISETPNYWKTCISNHFEANKTGELIVRVLVLPGHLDCCAKPILKWVAENLGVSTRVNLMFQYRPEWRAHEIPELRRRLNQNEMEKAIAFAQIEGLKNLII